MPRESDVAVWLHAMRLASAGRRADWDRAFDAQQAHAEEQQYNLSNLVLSDLLDDAAWRFIGGPEPSVAVDDTCSLCDGAGGRMVPTSWNMTQGEVYETRWEPCPECGEDQP